MRKLEEHSSINLFNNKQEHNFDQSFTTPLKLAQCRTKPNTFKHKQNKSTLGEYEQYKLTNYMRQMHNYDDKETANNYYCQSEQSSRVIDAVTIDPDSSVLQIGQQFSQIMLNHISNEVVFIAVSGQKQAGKSFFCDKLLNLAEVKGNNFSQKRGPGLYTFSVPFIKDDLCIFLLQVSGCEINTDMFRLLNLIAMALSSSYIFISDENNKHWDSFQQSLQKTEKLLYRSNSNASQLFPNILYFVSRSKQQSSIELKSNVFFKSIQTLHLTDAMTVGYAGRRQDLSFISFLAKQCISPQFIKEVHSIFITVYNDIKEKQYEQLVVRGNIAQKILLAIITNLNSNKLLNLSSIYENVVKQLYVTAFNYCVMVYHEELEKYFEDEQPKNTDEMYKAFEKASMNALSKFNNYNMNEQLHEQFQQKLIDHIDSKQQLICSINKEKTKELLREHFSKHNGDAISTIEMLKSYRKQLDDGRIDAMKQTILEMIRMAGSEKSVAKVRQLEQLSIEKQQLKSKYEQLIDRKNEAKNKKQSAERKYKKLEDEEESLEKQTNKIQQQIKSLTKRQRDLENGGMDDSSVKELRKQLEKLREKQHTSAETLNVLRSGGNQVADDYQERINNTIKKQKLIEKQLQQLQKQQPSETQSPPKNKQSKQKQKSIESNQSKSKTK